GVAVLSGGKSAAGAVPELQLRNLVAGLRGRKHLRIIRGAGRGGDSRRRGHPLSCPKNWRVGGARVLDKHNAPQPNRDSRWKFEGFTARDTGFELLAFGSAGVRAIHHVRQRPTARENCS